MPESEETMKYSKRYPFSLLEYGSYLEHAKDVLIQQHDPDAVEKIKKINRILAKESPYTPSLAGPEVNKEKFKKGV